MIFVRSTENNHYLTTLQNSGIWDTSCGIETYQKIQLYTGFDIHGWIESHVDWMNDFTSEMRDMIQNNNLHNYLIW